MNFVIGIISAVLFALGAGTLALAQLRGRESYEEWTEDLDRDVSSVIEESKLKSLLPAGLYLDESFSPFKLFPTNLQTVLAQYENRVLGQLIELYGEQQRALFTSIHHAERWAISLLALSFFSGVALILCLQGDGKTGLTLDVIAIIAACGASFLIDKQLETKIQERRESILLEFPEFVNKLILLVNAGEIPAQAWNEIVEDSEDKNTPLYRELRACKHDIDGKMPLDSAYEAFARRCKLKEVIKMVAVIITSMRLGPADLTRTLRAQSDELWEARKAAARRLGEKASSKAMLPMALMLLGIILIVALPAILALTGTSI